MKTLTANLRALRGAQTPAGWSGFAKRNRRSRFTGTLKSRGQPRLGQRVAIPFAVEEKGKALMAYYKGTVTKHAGKHLFTVEFDGGAGKEDVPSTRSWLSERAFDACLVADRVNDIPVLQRWNELLDLPESSQVFVPLDQQGEAFSLATIVGRDKRGNVRARDVYGAPLTLAACTEWYTPAEHRALKPTIGMIPDDLVRQRASYCSVVRLIILEHLLAVRDAADTADDRATATKLSQAFGADLTVFPTPKTPAKGQDFADAVEGLARAADEFIETNTAMDRTWTALARRKPSSVVRGKRRADAVSGRQTTAIDKRR